MENEQRQKCLISEVLSNIKTSDGKIYYRINIAYSDPISMLELIQVSLNRKKQKLFDNPEIVVEKHNKNVEVSIYKREKRKIAGEYILEVILRDDKVEKFHFFQKILIIQMLQRKEKNTLY